jgi:putative aldouronate transport system substrate-binding protein
MTKMLKRVVIGSLILVLLFASACSNKNSESPKASGSNSPPQSPAASAGATEVSYTDKKDIEVMAWWPINVESDDQIIKFIEEKFNVNLKITVADWQPNIDNLTMRIASGDYPTYLLMPWYWVNNLGPQYQSLIEDKLAMNISEYVEKYGFDNIKEQLNQATDAGVKAIYADDKGDYYSIPRNDGYPNQALYIRKDWLEQLNLPMPKTWDDVENVLQAFVEKDPDGQKNVGFTSDGIGSLEHIIASFTGIHSSGWTKQNGQWTNKVMLPEFKDAIAFLHGMYSKGLIDKEFLYLKTTNAREKLTTGRAGMMIYNANAVDYTDFTEVPLKKYKADAEITIPVPFPSGPKGEIRVSGDPYGSTGILFANKDDEINVRMLAILNWLLSEEGTDLSLNGIKGIHYDLVDGKIQYNEDKWQKDFKGIEHHFIRHLVFPGVAKEQSARVLPILKENYEDIIEHGVLPEIVGVSTENTAAIQPKLNEIYSKWVFNFIIGDAELEKDWSRFMDEYKKAGYETVLKDVSDYAAANGK